MLLDNLKIHVAGVQETGSKIRLTFIILEALPTLATPAPVTKEPGKFAGSAKIELYPGFKKVGEHQFNIDAASAAGVQRGQEFSLTAK